MKIKQSSADVGDLLDLGNFLPLDMMDDKHLFPGTPTGIAKSAGPVSQLEWVSRNYTSASLSPMETVCGKELTSGGLFRPDDIVKTTFAAPPGLQHSKINDELRSPNDSKSNQIGSMCEIVDENEKSGWQLEKLHFELCSTHHNEQKCLYCNGCNVSCCLKCAMKYHFSHKYLTARFAATGTTVVHSKGVQECAEMLISLYQTENRAAMELRSEFAKLTLALEQRKTKLEGKIREIANKKRVGLRESLFRHIRALAENQYVDVKPCHSQTQICLIKLDSCRLLRWIERFGHIGSNAFGPNCTMFGSNLSTAVIREPFRFQVQVRDHLGAVICVGGDEVLANAYEVLKSDDQFGCSYPVHIKDYQNGKYLVSVVFYHPGDFQLSVTVNGKSIQGSPFKVENSNDITGYKLIKKVIGKYSRRRVLSDADSRKVSIDSGLGSDQFKGEDWLFCRPWGVCCSPNGTLFVADRCNNGIKIFDANHVLILSFGCYGTGAGEFNRPSGVAFDARLNRLIVSDKDNHRIQVFDIQEMPFGNVNPAQSVSVKPVRMFGQRGNCNGEFYYPWDCAVSAANSEIVVSDSKNNRIQLLTSDGVFLSKYEADMRNLRSFDFPRGVAFTPSNRIIVSDFNNHRIFVFNTNMVIERWFGRAGSALGQLNRPQGVAVDNRGNIIVSDSRNYRIQIFKPDGTIRHAFGRMGSGDGSDEMDRPAGVCVSPKGEITVVDFGNNRLLVF